MPYIPPMRKTNCYDINANVDMNADREGAIKNRKADLLFQQALRDAGAIEGIVTASKMIAPQRYAPQRGTYIKSSADF